MINSPEVNCNTAAGLVPLPRRTCDKPAADVRTGRGFEQCLPPQGRVEGLYIVLISLHGLVRGQHMELGKDADTGGQVCMHGVSACCSC